MRICLKIYLSILFCCTMLFVISGCGKNEYNIGEEFTLSIGETASIHGEDLRIQFLEISEDSRCPRNVTCVWEGRAIAIIEVFIGDTSQKIELIEQGLTDIGTKRQFEEYEFVFRILPYPEKAEVQISPDEYRLILTVTKE
ncbi:MAG: hypothetical protein JSU58_04875 [Dehalococcoidales bacterium]|nr:MAG: hypothetical protein JSU58_04875 [Dehalococcoidales bacterium]